MVVSLGPGKFYGSSLPRPRIYTDVKLNDHRVDPPVPVLDPFLSWANEAHWSMGGLSFRRLRLQGRIEGNVSKLRAERERLTEKNVTLAGPSSGSGSNGSKFKRAATDSPPPAPMAAKRRRFTPLIDEDEDSGAEEGEEEGGEVAASRGVRRRRLVKKLGDDFDRVALETEIRKSSPLMGFGNGSEGVALRTRSRKLEEEDDASETVMQMVEEANRSTWKGKNVKSGTKGKGNRSGSTAVGKVRTSPRLAKRG